MKVNVHIERLIVDDLGQGPLRTERVQAAVQAEIERHLHRRGSGWPTGTRDPAGPVDGGQVTVTGAPGGGPGPERLGRQIGRAVWRSVSE